MKRKHLFYSLALAAVFGACTQDDFVASVSTSETVSNDFSQYVGVPFEGDVTFTRVDDVQTRIGLDDELDWTWVEGDKVGLVWLNSDAISYSISNYDYSLETDEDVVSAIEAYDEVNGYGAYHQAIANGDITPEDGSYVWGLWPSSWKTFSNTLMTYETVDGSQEWHMTDGNIYKGMYIAYFPYQSDRQSTSKFTVTQNALQEQNATTYASNAEAASTIANHIISTEPGVGMVWISQNDGEATTTGQNSSFVYKLAEQDTESGTADVVNILMRPFSDILDLRILVGAGDVDADVANSIQIESVDLIASTETFATKASFDFSCWGNNQDNNGVWAIETQLDGPNYFTYDIAGTSVSGKYTEEDLVETLTNSIQSPAPNNGQQQRVQLMMLPMYTQNQATALAMTTPTYMVRINTDYGYIDIPEIVENGGWRYTTTPTTGLVINSNNVDENTAFVSSRTDGSKNLNYIRTVIGQRATRYITFDASDLTYDYVDVCSTEDLIEAITKWNNLGKKDGTFTVNVESADCSFDNLVWSATADEISVKTQTLTEENQLPEESISLGTADEAIQKFIANGNTLVINSNDAINIGGTSAIGDSSDKLVFSNKINVTGTLGIATDVTLTNGMDIAENGTVIISDSSDASLWVGDDSARETNAVSSTWNGALYLYQDGTLTLGRHAKVTNNGEVHVNGNFILKGAASFINEGDVYLYANAAVEDENAGTRSTFTNNSTIYYVDVIKSFDAEIDYTNNGKVVASIIGKELSNHKNDYLKEANDFGANTLIIQGVAITSEWNNTGELSNFEDVQLNGYIEWNIYNAINIPNATVTVSSTVYLISNGRNAAITCKNVVLAANAQLHVEVSEAATSGDMSITCDSVTMYNNTYLYGYDYFSCYETQPAFEGTGVHRIYDSEGNAMFD